MKYKSETFESFKDFRHEVENQLGRNIKKLWSGRGGEYLSAEFIDYLKENENKPENLPSIIFLDINMPIVDGFVFLYEFEKFNELVRNKCKVIILSSSDNKRDIDKIVNNNHVIKFITKPLTEVALDEIKLNNM